MGGSISASEIAAWMLSGSAAMARRQASIASPIRFCCASISASARCNAGCQGSSEQARVNAASAAS